MKTKATGNFSKVRKLITVLKKCNGKTVIGGGSAGISSKVSKILAYGGLLALTIALFFGAYFIQPVTGGISVFLEKGLRVTAVDASCTAQ